ncbi:MAG: hypothetical protein CMP24_06390 [Rickettsiales bacterium]|nr:hypothetical protein [Rickettsiales bacterium]
MITDIKGWSKNRSKLSLLYRNRIDKIFNSLDKDIDTKFTYLSSKEDKLLFKKIRSISNQFKNKKRIFLIGIGGSSLGAKTILDVDYNDKITFLENIDPAYIRKKLLSVSDKSIGFIIISKSGETLEILSIISIIEKHFFNNIQLSSNSIVITDNKNSTLSRLARNRKIPIVYSDSNIGGRYSCFSMLGLLPLHIAGLDSQKIKNLANRHFRDYLNKNKKTSKKNISSLVNFVSNRKISGHVFLCYIESFQTLMLWYRQLWAESIGKKGKGIHLMPAIGSVDQHSQLQMWIDGKKDLIFTVVVPKKRSRNFKIIDKSNILPPYLNNKSIGEIINKMSHATILELKKLKIPVRIIYIEDDTFKSAVQLMTNLMMEVSILGLALNINPFDQPAVEKAKKSTKKLLANNV